jgi:hypothetical protein
MQGIKAKSRHSKKVAVCNIRRGACGENNLPIP